jgi:phosphatidate cytidylyltransferase
MLATMVLILALAVWYVAVPRVTISDVALTAFAAIYCGFSFSSVSLIRACDPGNEGALLAFGVMGSIWLNDTFAYFVGSRFGSHKLAPRISPNKSWEGFFGGLVGCLIIWCVGAAFHVCGLSWPLAIICGLCEGVVSVMGDLFESRVKRGVGVKDSGNLLPGHGGLLDRMDSVLFGGTVAYFILLLGGIL